ncbi:MAG: UDP-3-O-(3-hydroxymyristoyl)glucosamine N-acyltransferase [Sulfuricurvum sp. RIFOXYD2_FULL_44_160]|uniref:UDP-3-O-acylglucosamine N-acyltransferase n=1 Tax=Sulfuricurvum kujiense TaxID=148813 RepID=A0A2D3WGE8_9BACT|nr:MULTISPECIES: UDP-3-O-(3-hydroxymyristoyl)glucosamine N-acyltransferase [Sulfuricurvum]OHD91539.1 MAG: UDP-3-O-(3-hydroxymyristoyl)glucosamine N-acyltransferase [Sulfuricurvum sp. RIFOXYD12_FULL_44_77]OHD91593.1 MAG: UDP-3-O-(3-hydroxymyristoyl)glucosamine N-acyltransferase [Sulfuricurvum sp. RIFOXYD2_FULL_44_160]DAB38975.1 MAG TPA: UDP-3-O-(3-hydroxymyristoyl)glucosamine N-acyltransferase [Sulfuricurvum kujiense]
MKLYEIAAFLGFKEINDTIEISGLNTLREAVEGEISFLSDSKYEKELSDTRASAVILPSAKAHLLPKGVVALESDEPYMSVALLSKHFAKSIRSSETAPIIGEGTHIYPTAHIENGARIGAHCTIMSGVYVGAESVIGDNVILYPNVTIYRDCLIGNRVMIHAGTVIGSDGFGYAHTKMGEHIKLYQNGNVIIEDDVEIGANTTVDCAVFGSTVVKQGSKIDNLVQIGHNCVVGEHSILVSQSGLAGSTTLGRNVVMGGQSATAGHLSIAPFTTLAARSGVTKSIINKGIYSGFPLMEHKIWLKMQAKLAKMMES